MSLTYRSLARDALPTFVAVQVGTGRQRTVSTGRGAVSLVVGAVVIRVAADVPIALDGRELDRACRVRRLGCLVDGRDGTEGGDPSEDADGDGETHGG
jgi:hypothetical protein